MSVTGLIHSGYFKFYARSNFIAPARRDNDLSGDSLFIQPLKKKLFF